MLVRTPWERLPWRSDAGAEIQGVVGVPWVQRRQVGIRETIAKAVSVERA